MNKKTSNSSETRESFYVQNVTPGPHYVSDIKLSFQPLEVIDLTFRDPDEIRGSQNLKESLRMGYLRKISPEEAERLAEVRASKLRKGVTKLQQASSRMQDVDVDGKTLEVEAINLSRTDSSKVSEQVSMAGYANDPLSYTVALDIAQAEAEAKGETLTVEEFADATSRDSGLVRRLITQNTGASMRTAMGKDTRAVYATPPESDEYEAGIHRQRMRSTEDDGDGDHSGAEAIDLTKED
jgi:hypothetical protein